MTTYNWFHRLCEEVGYTNYDNPMQNFLFALDIKITWGQAQYLYDLEEAI